MTQLWLKFDWSLTKLWQNFEKLCADGHSLGEIIEITEITDESEIPRWLGVEITDTPWLGGLSK